MYSDMPLSRTVGAHTGENGQRGKIGAAKGGEALSTTMPTSNTGVEQAFRPAVETRNTSASAAEVMRIVMLSEVRRKARLRT